MPRWSVPAHCVCVFVAAAACVDVGDFRGEWSGPRVGEGATHVGFETRTPAQLVVEAADLGTLRARLTTGDERFQEALIEPIAGAEADVLADMTFAGSPLRVFLAFAEASDGGGPALVVVALYSEPRIELRILRSGDEPLYGIFELSRP